MIFSEPAISSTLSARVNLSPPILVGGRAGGESLAPLERAIENLQRLPAITEERFTLVGTRLRDISAGLKSITANSAEAGSLMAGEDARRLIADLESLFREMEGYFLAADQTAGRAGDSLEGILQELQQMHRLMVGFRDQVGNLRMLKMLTNIQSASMSGKGAGFGNVAADIGKLSQSVQSSSVTIIDRIKALRADLEMAVEMLSVFAGRQKHLGGMVVSSMRRDIAALVSMHVNCSGGVNTVSGEAEAMSREVNNLVVSMQFQDITRQQMDHAREALAEIRADLEGGANGETAGICALQSAQLMHCSGELETAVAEMTSSLRSIAVRAAASAASIHGMFVLADEVGGSSIGDMEQGMASIAASFAENVVTNRNLNATMLTVTQAMAEITSFAEEIDYIGSEIRLIALNAIIKAVQAGRDGAAFSVIADTVKRQSVEVCDQAAAVVAIIDTIGGHISALQLTMGGGEGNLAAGTDACIHQERLAETFANLKQFSERVRLLLERSDAASAALVGCVHRALSAMDAGEIGLLMRQGVIAELERLVNSMGGHSGGGAAAAALGLERHAGRYTMGSERRVHQMFAGSIAGQPGGSTGGVGFSNPRGGEFGENVEFF